VSPTLRPVAYDDPEVARLVDAMGEELSLRYGDGGRSPAAPQDFQLPGVLLAALVAHARSHGMTRLQLETGTEQPEAVGLYESEGWQPVPPFGHYADDPRTRCYALDLS
jgi:GNAT superfamily N-acetyltransferase